jgi:hypothetical protein
MCVPCFEHEHAAFWTVPWEQRRRIGRFRAFWRTARETMVAPNRAFVGLEPYTSKWWDPISYALFAQLFVMASLALFITLLFALGAIASGDRDAKMFGIIEGVVLGGIAIGVPIYAVVRVFLLSGIEHLLLMLLGSAGGGFEATLRAHCYSCGPLTIAAVPGCGFWVGEVWHIVLRIFGYRAVHRTTGGRAALAVLLPVGICGGAYFAVVILSAVAGQLVQH